MYDVFIVSINVFLISYHLQVHAELMSVKLELSSIQSESKMTRMSLEKELHVIRTLYQEAKENLAATERKLEEVLSSEAKSVSITTLQH